ncbi:MAG: rod-binding protein [Planctomycetota bacterium]|jgi:hypothetical protein
MSGFELQPLSADAWRAPASAAGGPGASRSFAAELGRARQQEQTRDTPLRQAAADLVGAALVYPLFESMRNSPLNSDGPFAPGPGEKQFGPLLDMHLTDRVTRAASLPIVDAIARRLGDPGATTTPRTLGGDA